MIRRQRSVLLGTSGTNTENTIDIYTQSHTNTIIHTNIGSIMQNSIYLKTNVNTNTMNTIPMNINIISHSNTVIHTDMSKYSHDF